MLASIIVAYVATPSARDAAAVDQSKPKEAGRALDCTCGAVEAEETVSGAEQTLSLVGESSVGGAEGTVVGLGLAQLAVLDGAGLAGLDDGLVEVGLVKAKLALQTSGSIGQQGQDASKTAIGTGFALAFLGAEEARSATEAVDGILAYIAVLRTGPAYIIGQKVPQNALFADAACTVI